MLNRAAVEPDPAVALGLAADTMAAAAEATSLDDLFARRDVGQARQRQRQADEPNAMGGMAR